MSDCGSRGIRKQVEAAILSAARGSIMEFAWMTEAGSGDRVGVNPDHVLLLRVPEARVRSVSGGAPTRDLGAPGAGTQAAQRAWAAMVK